MFRRGSWRKMAGNELVEVETNLREEKEPNIYPAQWSFFYYRER